MSGDYNMPPGVSVNDIPGNRPQDIEQQRAEEHFWEVVGELEPQMIEVIGDGLEPKAQDMALGRIRKLLSWGDPDEIDAWADAIMEWRQKHQMLEGKKMEAIELHNLIMRYITAKELLRREVRTLIDAFQATGKKSIGDNGVKVYKQTKWVSDLGQDELERLRAEGDNRIRYSGLRVGGAQFMDEELRKKYKVRAIETLRIEMETGGDSDD